MFNRIVSKIRLAGMFRGLFSLTLLFLLIEFSDELNYGIEGAALPSIRTDLGMSYAQIGLLLGVPGILNVFFEPLIMLLGDTGLRKRLVVGGGFVIVLGVLLIGSAPSFPVVLLAMIILYPASGAFVTLAQASLMDANPGREAQAMARWTVAGSLGNLIGPLILAGGFSLAWGWRWAYFALAGLALLLTLAVLWQEFPTHHTAAPEHLAEARSTPRMMWANLKEAARNPRLLRWLILLDLSDLLLDVFTGYVPLYFSDVADLPAAQVSLVMGLFMAASLAADLVLIPLLERFPGRLIVRLSAGVVIVLYTSWLLVPWVWAKIALVVLIRLATLGWYQVLQGEAYSAVPGKSGTVMALSSAFGLPAGAVAALIGWVAEQAGLPVALWLLLAGPLSLLLFVPKAVDSGKWIVSSNQ